MLMRLLHCDRRSVVDVGLGVFGIGCVFVVVVARGVVVNVVVGAVGACSCVASSVVVVGDLCFVVFIGVVVGCAVVLLCCCGCFV